MTIIGIDCKPTSELFVQQRQHSALVFVLSIDRSKSIGGTNEDV
jgi:hypothetical protein